MRKPRDPELERAKRLRKNYDWSPEEWDDLYHAQRGLCGVCHHPLTGPLFPKDGPVGSRVANVDHRHGVKKAGRRGSVRGLVCGGRRGCNRKMGWVDDPDWLRAAISYLENPPARIALGAKEGA